LKADLHSHSTASDGEHQPAEVAAAAAAAGLTILALTDHDSVDGIPEARAAGEALGLEVIAGCEFSVRVGWGEMHLLGYFLPTENEILGSFLEGQRESRSERGREMANRLRSIGLDVEFSLIERIADGGAIGRPHVARALVEVGAVPDINAAFDRYIGYRKAGFVPKNLPGVEDVTALIASVGGVSSAAHLKDKANKKVLRYLKKSGVDGIEVLHPSHGLELRETISKRVTDVGLLKTGGTDWHGVSMAYNGGRLGEINVPEEWMLAMTSLHEDRIGRIGHAEENSG
jgi:predicted metal-dependent phosphoesterase TrpH